MRIITLVIVLFVLALVAIAAFAAPHEYPLEITVAGDDTEAIRLNGDYHHLMVSVPTASDSIYVYVYVVDLEWGASATFTEHWTTRGPYLMYPASTLPWNSLWDCSADSLMFDNRSSTSARVLVRGYSQ